MADLPRVQESDFVEREGINHVAATVNAARCVWREVLHRDLGIDGHIEYVTPEGLAPGRLIAAQVKSGRSRFTNATKTHVPYYAEEKHRRYWVEYPLPVILVLHNPIDRETVWVDARESLRVRGDEAAILVPRSQALDTDGVLRALECGGPLPSGKVDLGALLREMATPDAAAQGLCFLYTFAQGMTDIGSSLYFSIDVLHEVLAVMSADWDPPSFGIGPAEFDFADRYVAFLVRNDLARVDYAAWRQSALEHHMVGKIIAPLTARGRAVRDAINEADERLPASEDDPSLQPYSRAIVERFVQMIYNPGVVDEVAIRQRRIELVRATLA